MPTSESKAPLSAGSQTTATNQAIIPDSGGEPNDSKGVPTFEDDPPPAGAQLEFDTDFSKHSVPYNEILSGGPPKARGFILRL